MHKNKIGCLEILYLVGRIWIHIFMNWGHIMLRSPGLMQHLCNTWTYATPRRAPPNPNPNIFCWKSDYLLHCLKAPSTTLLLTRMTCRLFFNDRWWHYHHESWHHLRMFYWIFGRQLQERLILCHIMSKTFFLVLQSFNVIQVTFEIKVNMSILNLFHTLNFLK